MSGSPILSRFRLFATQSTFSWSDQESDLFPSHYGNLVSPLSLEKHLPDLFVGIQADKKATAEISNINTAIGTAGSEYGTVSGELSGYGDHPYGGTGDPTVSEIMLGEDIRGVLARAIVTDVENDTTILEVDGTVTSVSKGFSKATINISSQDADMFSELIPKKRVLEIYPNADLNNSSDQDVPVIVCFKSMRKVRLNQVQTATSAYDFGALRKPSAGSLWLNTVYRDSRVVTRSEWALTEVPTNYYVVRFTSDQRDFSNRLMTIQADIQSSEWSRPSEVVKFLLTDTTYGLRASASTSSFSSAQTDYAALSYTVDGGLSERRPAIDVVNQLCLHGALLDKDNTGAVTMSVDLASHHAMGTPSLGVGDGIWENIEPESILDDSKGIEERIRALTLNGLFDPGFANTGGSGSYLLKASRNRLEHGVESEESNPFIGDSTTLDKETDYRFKRLAYADNIITLKASLETKDLSLEDLVALYVPNLGYGGTQFEIRGIKFDGSAIEPGRTSNAAFEFTLGGYNSAAFTYVAGTVQAAPTASTVTDYSMTPPGAVTSFSVSSTTSRVTGTTQLEAYFSLTATAPSVNVTHLVFQQFIPGSSLPLATQVVVVAVSSAATVSFEGHPGNTYDFQCFARNVNNVASAQDGAVSTLSSQTADNAPGVPSVPTSLSATARPGKKVFLSWVNPTNTNLSHIEIHKNTTNAFSDDTTLLKIISSAGRHGTDTATLGHTYTDNTVAYGDRPWYAVRSVNTSGQKSTTFNSVQTDQTVKKTQQGDMDDDSVGTVQIIDANITSAKIGSLQVTNAKIDTVAANKIVTNTLTVDGGSTGAAVILCTGSGAKIRLQTIDASPTEITFETTGSTVRARISGSTTGTATLVLKPETDGTGNLSLGLASKQWDTFSIFSQEGNIHTSTIPAGEGLILDSYSAFIYCGYNGTGNIVFSPDTNCTTSVHNFGDNDLEVASPPYSSSPTGRNLQESDCNLRIPVYAEGTSSIVAEIWASNTHSG